MPSAKRQHFFGPWTCRSGSSHAIEVPQTYINTNVYPKTAPSSPTSKSPLNSPPRNGSPPNGLHNAIPHPSALRRHFSSTFMLIPEDQELSQIIDSKSISNGINVHANNLRDGDEKYPVGKLHIILRLLLWCLSSASVFVSASLIS